MSAAEHGSGNGRTAGENAPGGPGVPAPRRRGPPVIILLPVLLACVIVPYLFWHGTWFGTPLSDEDIVARLEAVTPSSLPEGKDALARLRQAQHALEQISKRIQNDESPEKFYPLLPPLAEHPEPLIRGAAAWVMGEDNEEPSFVAPLRSLVEDAAPTVRRNAALALARRADPAALPVLRRMLEPYDVAAPAAGKVTAIVPKGTPLQQTNEVARIENGGRVATVRAPLRGRVSGVRVQPGAHVQEGAALCSLEPTAQEVFYALIALSRLGTLEDVPRVERFAEPRDGYGRKVREQAKLTKDAIAKRGR